MYIYQGPIVNRTRHDYCQPWLQSSRPEMAAEGEHACNIYIYIRAHACNMRARGGHARAR